MIKELRRNKVQSYMVILRTRPMYAHFMFTILRSALDTLLSWSLTHTCTAQYTLFYMHFTLLYNYLHLCIHLKIEIIVYCSVTFFKCRHFDFFPTVFRIFKNLPTSFHLCHFWSLLNIYAHVCSQSFALIMMWHTGSPYLLIM